MDLQQLWDKRPVQDDRVQRLWIVLGTPRRQTGRFQRAWHQHCIPGWESALAQRHQRFQDCEGVVRDDNKAAKMELSVVPIWYGKLPGEGSESHVRRKEEDSLIAVGPVWQIVPAT
jgi:hypothetical protein